MKNDDDEDENDVVLLCVAAQRKNVNHLVRYHRKRNVVIPLNVVERD